MTAMPSYPRTYSPYTLEALQLLGEQIRLGRRERLWTQAELAERAGVSIRTLNRVEHGDPHAGLGTAFELATLVGVPLFHPDRERLSMDLDRIRARSALLPQRIRRAGKVDDEF
jgi:transcriptional regulator with XRE-family HTH domain